MKRLALLLLLLANCRDGEDVAKEIDRTAQCKVINSDGHVANNKTYYCLVFNKPMLCDEDGCMPYHTDLDER